MKHDSEWYSDTGSTSQDSGRSRDLQIDYV
jgi:hypothetical protein